jgi:exopolysaccharide production protein ExoQ
MSRALKIDLTAACRCDNAALLHASDGIDSAPADLSTLESALITLVLVLLCGTLPVVMLHDLLGLKTVPIWPVYVALYGLVAVCTLMRGAVALHGITAAGPVLLVSALPLLSTLWSVTPVETAVQALTLMGTTLVGFYLASALTGMQALRVLMATAVLAPLLDLLAILVLPSIGIHSDGPWAGTWKGLHDQKNGLGAFCLLQILVLLLCVRGQGRLTLLVAFGLLLNTLLFVAAKSTTSWLTAALCIPIVLAPYVVLRGLSVLVPLGLAVGAVVMLAEPDIASELLQALPGLVGKDSTLSNRLPVWAVLGPYIETVPWLGFGYGAFWTDAFMPGEVFMARIFFLPGSAHSSVMELRLGLGWIGLAAVGLVLGHIFLNLWRTNRRIVASGAGYPMAPFALALLLYLVMQSLTESVLLVRNDLIWVLFVWTATSLSLAARTTEESAGHHQFGGDVD